MMKVLMWCVLNQPGYALIKLSDHSSCLPVIQVLDQRSLPSQPHTLVPENMYGNGGGEVIWCEVEVESLHLRRPLS